MPSGNNYFKYLLIMKRRRTIKIPVYITLSSLILIMTGACHKGSNSYTFETDTVKKGSIINTIPVTGTLQADTTVLVGTQVSGVIKKMYVDFNSEVKKGQLLAELDKTPLETQVQQAQAALEDSKSEVEFQSASYERYKALLDKKLVAKADYDQVKYNYERAKANLKTAQAGYDKARVNLSYALIYSPISGVVLNRAVDQGQTVAASFSTPNLFTIGSDLTKMQVQANVDEADIGQIVKGQHVSFIVDAYPSETFSGDVRQIRLQPVVTSNVVTYTVIINAPNPERKLLPGMTATLTVLVQKIDSVLIIPGKALRFTPDAAWLAEYTKKNPYPKRQGPGGSAATEGQKGEERQPVAIGQAGQDHPAEHSTNNRNQDSIKLKKTGAVGQSNSEAFQGEQHSGKKPVMVWVKSGEKIHRARIITGADDGSNIEVKWGLKEGDEVIISMSLPGKTATSAAAAAPATSPFMPQRPGATRR
jgi:HlyD family secretion protein